MNVKILLAVALLASLAGHAAENSIAIVGATVIHPEHELPAAVERDRTVLITGNRIVRIGPRAGTRVPAGATRIDGKGKWVVPGLVDAHVHFFQSGNLYTRPDVADFNAVVPYVEEVARNKARLPATFKLWLASGVTSVVDIGGPSWNVEMRGAARKSSPAPAAGVRLPVHATELEVAKAALRAGADYLVHSVEDAPVDQEFLALAKKNRALYCPTLFVVMGYRYALSNTWRPTPAERRLADPQILAAMGDLARIPPEKLPERVAKAMADTASPEPSAVELQNLRTVWDAGIPVAMGTDAGNIGTLHGPSVFREP